MENVNKSIADPADASIRRVTAGVSRSPPAFVSCRDLLFDRLRCCKPTTLRKIWQCHAESGGPRNRSQRRPAYLLLIDGLIVDSPYDNAYLLAGHASMPLMLEGWWRTLNGANS